MSELNIVKRLKEIQRNLVELSQKQAVIGVIDNSVRSDGLTNADLLAIHEFGAVINHPGGTGYSKNGKGKTRFVSGSFVGPVNGVTGPHKIVIPERPVLRTTLTNNKQAISNVLSKSVAECLRGNLSVDETYDITGKFVRTAVMNTFNENDFTPNKAKTIKRKKSSKALIDTGALRASISYEVRNRE